jgi:C1A family cysteine protease
MSPFPSAVIALDYNDIQGRLIVRNLWGPKLGMEGFFIIPYGHLIIDDLSADFWTFRLVDMAGFGSKRKQ